MIDTCLRVQFTLGHDCASEDLGNVRARLAVRYMQCKLFGVARLVFECGYWNTMEDSSLWKVDMVVAAGK